MKNEVKLYVGESLGKYGFPDGHPFGTDRQAAFWKEAVKRGLDRRAAITDPRMAAQEELHRFHTPEHVAWVKEKSDEGHGTIDYIFRAGRPLKHEVRFVASVGVWIRPMRRGAGIIQMII